MASTKFYLDLRGRASDGRGTILIQIFHNHSMTSVSTGVRVAPNEWDGFRVVKRDESEIINSNLQSQKAKLDRQIAALSLSTEFQYMTAADIKHAILKDKPSTTNGHLISDLFNEYINNGNLKEGTKEIYRATLKKVTKFAGESARIEQVNLKWLRAFESFLSKTQGVNGRAIFLRHFRAICKYAKKIGIQYQYPFEDFKIKQEPTKKRCICAKTLYEFMTYPTSERNAMYRDYFFLMFYLIGVNTIDVLTAKKTQIVNGRFEYIRAKTGKFYSIKIEPEAQELLDKYAGKGEYLVDALDHCKHYRSFAREINDAIKLIGPEEVAEIPSDNLFDEPETKKVVHPIIGDVVTYSARHTWATLAPEAGIPIDVVSQALGHSFANRTTLIYVKLDQNKVDEANRKVIDFFLTQGGSP